VRGSGIEILGGVFCQYLDPSSTQAGLSSKMIVDSTGPKIGTLYTGAMPDAGELKGSMKIKDASFPCEGNPNLCAVKTTADVGDLSVLLVEPSLSQCRLIICVDEDIDIRDGRQILWAMATRFQPAEDAILGDGRMVLDARKPKDWVARRATIPLSAYPASKKL
jgi:3-polyprenyl-4-hydroxybenzoate decarboxylase